MTTGNSDHEHGTLRADMRNAFRAIDKLVVEVRDMREVQVQAVVEQARSRAEIQHLGERLGATEQLAVRVLTLEHKEAQRAEAEREHRSRGEADRQARQRMLYSVVGSCILSAVGFIGMLVLAGWAVVQKNGSG